MRFRIENQKLGFVLAVLAAVFWSMLGVLGKFAYSLGADPITVISFRAAIATFIVACVIVATDVNHFRIKRSDVPFFAGYGFFGVALNYIGYFYALKFTTVATAITLLYTYPAIVVVIAFFLFHESITRRKSIALALSFLGVLLTAFGLSSNVLPLDPRGLLLGLLAGVANAVYAIAGKRGQATYSALTVLFYSFLFGAISLAAFYFAELGVTVNLNSEIMFVILIIALIPTLMGYGLYTFSLRLTEAGRSSITTSIEPAAAILLAYIFLGEVPSSIQLAGTALVVIGVIVVQTGK